MKPKDFVLLDDENIIWKSVEPIVLKVRGKSPQVKAQVIKKLNSGQRALFLFQVLYGHANHGINQFFYQISYLTDTFDIWAALKSTMIYFDDMEMLSIIEKMESIFYSDFETKQSNVSLHELDRLYTERIPSTIKLISSFIRDNPTEFMQFED